jgi:hypothetical protein
MDSKDETNYIYGRSKKKGYCKKLTLKIDLGCESYAILKIRHKR